MSQANLEMRRLGCFLGFVGAVFLVGFFCVWESSDDHRGDGIVAMDRGGDKEDLSGFLGEIPIDYSRINHMQLLRGISEERKPKVMNRGNPMIEMSPHQLSRGSSLAVEEFTKASRSGGDSFHIDSDESWESEWESFERYLQSDSNETIWLDTTANSSNVIADVDANAAGEQNSIKTVTIDISAAILIVTVALGTVAALLSIVSGILIFVHRKNDIVAIGQPPFLYLIAFGSLLMSSELFFLFRYHDNSGFEDESTLDATCVVELWFQNIGSVCVHMAIFCKLWRANKVAQFRRNQKILAKHVIWPFVGMMATVVALTIAQTITDPPTWQIATVPSVVIGGNGNNALQDEENVVTLVDIGTCKVSLAEDTEALLLRMAEETNASVEYRQADFDKYHWIEICNIVLNFLSLILMLYIAYVTRTIPEDISDSRRVFQATFAQVCLWLILFLFFWIGRWINVYGISVMAWSLIYFIQAILFVAFLLVPKLYNVWRARVEPHPDESIGRLTSGVTSRGTNSSRGTNTTRGRGHVYVTGLDPALIQGRESPGRFTSRRARISRDTNNSRGREMVHVSGLDNMSAETKTSSGG